MPFLPPILMAALTGFIAGLVLSIPVGPINLTILNEGARRGFKWAILIGLGATTMEVIYCFIAFTSFASFFTKGYIKAVMELFSFVFLLFLGVKFLLTKSGPSHVTFGAAVTRLEARLGQRLQAHSAFMTGLLRVMGNVGVLVFWIILAANFISREWVTPDWPGKLACVGGVALGTGLWFFVLSWLSSLGRGKFSEKTLIKMEHFSGVLLLIVALAHGGTIIWQMHKAGLTRHPQLSSSKAGNRGLPASRDGTGRPCQKSSRLMTFITIERYSCPTLDLDHAVRYVATQRIKFLVFLWIIS